MASMESALMLCGEDDQGPQGTPVNSQLTSVPFRRRSPCLLLPGATGRYAVQLLCGV